MKVAIAGAGAVGRSVARELIENEHDVTLIERKPEHIDVDAIPAAHWQLGDACEVSMLELVKLHEFDVVVAQYHDQGLIALKTLEFDRAVNVTLGLPFVRTSPDHGTAYDIAGTGTANASSMIAAIEYAARAVRGRIIHARRVA